MHYELDRSDVKAGKNEDILSYFNKNTSLVDNNFSGTAMSIASIFTPFLDDEVKTRVTKHAKKQLTMVSNLKLITLSGTQILNWADTKMKNTLYRELMMIESIYDKKVIKVKGSNTCKGLLFYSIISNQKYDILFFKSEY